MLRDGPLDITESRTTRHAKKRILISLAGMLLLVLVGVGFALRAFRQIERAGALRQQAYIELVQAARFLSSLKDAETGYRGFLLTRDEAFLQPYRMVRDTLGPSLASLRQSTASAAARGHLENAEPLVSASLAAMDEGIALRRRLDFAPAAMTARANQGKRLMDQLRAELQGFTRIEEGELAAQAAAYQERLRTLLGVIIAASVLTLVLALLIAYLFNQEAQRRVRNRALLETRRSLEQQTALNLALQQAHATLQASREKLHRTEESFRLMVESVVDCAIVMLDPDGRVLTWNSGAQRIKGYTAEEIVGQSFDRFYSPEDVAGGSARRTLDAVRAQGRFETQGWRVRKDGSLFWASVILTAIRDQDGVLHGFAKLTQDLTERRRAEGELHEARETAERASLAKSNFLSSMSHELRTPLNAILGFAQLMDTGTPPPLPAQKASLAHILKAGWHLLALVNEILDLAKVESGQVSMSREPVSLTEVLAECRDMVGPQAAGRGHALDFPAGALPLFVLADRTRLKQVLLNLLSNAIKYNAPQGAVTVRCCESRPGHVRVEVRDQGPGLRPEQVAQLFQPFNRLEEEAGLKEGTGIGLVVAKRLVELMEGSIGVESAVGQGSTFWFELLAAGEPRLPEPGAGTPAPALAAPGAPARLVLYVEDNPANLVLMEKIIARHPGLRLLGAVDGASGLELARSALPEVILMDINLPGMSGFETLRHLRADPATAHIPVIALSANAMAGDHDRGLRAGFRSYLTKPIKVPEFVAALRDALAGL